MKVQEHFVVRLGGNDYLDTPNLIVYQGEPVLKVTRDKSNDELTVEAEIFDAEGHRKARIRGDRQVDGDPGAVDIHSTATSYTIRDRSNDRVVCEIRRRAGQQKMDVDVSVLMHMPDGSLIHANPAQSNTKTPQGEEVLRGRDAAISL
jgi:hypothetical protein